MFLAKLKLFIPRGDKLRKKSTIIANALAIELLNYGLNLDQEIINRLITHTPTQTRKYADSILKAYTAGNLTPPLFPEWEKRTEFTLGERVFQIVGYILKFTGADLEDPVYMATLRDNVIFKKYKTVRQASFAEAEDHFNNLIAANVGQNRKQQETMLEFAKIFRGSDTYIRSDEARVMVLMASGYDFIDEMKCKPSDAMRYFAAKVDLTTINLPHDVKYANLKWGERIQTLRFWANMNPEKLMEAMSHNRGAWTRFFRHMQLFKQRDFAKRFPAVVAAAWVSSGNRLGAMPVELESTVKAWIGSGLVELTGTDGALVYRSEASRIQAALDTGKWKTIRAALDGKSSYLLRNLMTVTGAIKEKHHDALRTWVKESIIDANINVLLSLLQINTDSKFRIIDAKGTTSIQPANYPEIIKDIQGDIETEVTRRHGRDGTIAVSKALANDAVPFLSRNQELDRGSKFSFEDKPYLYFFMHWVQNGHNNTDLDHSFLLFDSKMNLVETINYANQVNAFISSSGDLTSAYAPEGSTEYGRIDLSKAPKNIRFIVPICNVYSGSVFSENDEAYAGFQFSSDATFRLQRDHVRYDLNQPALANMPFVIDLAKKDITIMDFNQRDKKSSDVSGYVNDVKKMVSAIQTRNTMTIGRFATLLSNGGKTIMTIKRNPTGASEMAPADLSSLLN